MFNVNLSLDEFHLIFGTLQDRMLQNQKDMKSMVRFENLYDEIIEDQSRYNHLANENKDLKALLDKLHNDTNKQLGLPEWTR